MNPTHRIVILTGAGISAESGVPTFRDQNGLWEGHKVEEVATPKGFAKNPELVQRFYNLRRAALKTVEPNAAHIALAELEARLPGQVTVITQNVDDLHERAGSKSVLHMHGSLAKARCTHCGHRAECPDELATDTACPACQKTNGMRPDIVWFGEIPYHLDEIKAVLKTCTQFVSIGTSGLVFPAANFVKTARYKARAITTEINNAPTAISYRFHKRLVGPATEKVPAWARAIP